MKRLEKKIIDFPVNHNCYKMNHHRVSHLWSNMSVCPLTQSDIPNLSYWDESFSSKKCLVCFVICLSI